MSGGVVLIVVIILFIFVIIGFNDEVKARSEAWERKEASEKRIANLLRSLPYAQTTNEAYNIFSALSAEYQSFYNSGYYFQGYRQVDRIIAKAEKIYKTRCKELDNKEKQERIYNEIKNKVQITKQYFEQLVKYSNEDINKYTFQENESDLLIWIDNLYLKTLEHKLNEIISLINQNNEKGKELEEQGNFKEAAIFYEKNLTIDYSDKLCIDRLLNVYRKLKDYENEKRICDLAIQKYSGKKYKDRLLTIEEKITKASNP